MIGCTDKRERQLVGNSSSPSVGNIDARESGDDCVMCPNLRRGRMQNLCRAYLGRTMVPSVFEEENYCSNRSHEACAWFQARAREVM